jgi:lysophospholipase L1-like esterase
MFTTRGLPSRTRWPWRGVLAAAALSLVVVQNPTRADEHFGSGGHWIGTWGASPQEPVTFTGFPGAPSFSNQSIRQIVRISSGGTRFRVRLTNEFGTQSLLVGAARIGISAGGSSVKPGSDRALTFSGNMSVAIPTGAPVLSDPVDLTAGDLASLVISLYLPQDTGPATWHFEGKQTAYITSGDTTAASTLAGATTSASRYFLSGVDVLTFEAKSVIVTFGDSITDGTNSTVDTNKRWPDHLADRLASFREESVGVVNEGISGNRILHDQIGPNALSRVDRDVLATPGVRFMTILLGINDIGFGGIVPNEVVSADDIIAGYRQVIARAHASGIRIYGATLTPFEGVNPPYFSPEGEIKREAVNQWIRSSGEFDAVIDFEAVVRDPTHPTRLAPKFDSGDHLHPNDAGYTAMANSIDLRLFRPAELSSH